MRAISLCNQIDFLQIEFAVLLLDACSVSLVFTITISAPLIGHFKYFDQFFRSVYSAIEILSSQISTDIFK